MLNEVELRKAFDDASPVLWKGQRVIVARFETDHVEDGDLRYSRIVSVTVRLNGEKHEVSADELSLEH
jgi:hypothetical protein